MESDVSRPSEEDIERLRQAQWSERDPQGRAFASIAEAHRLRGELHLAKTVAQEGVERLPEFASGHVVAGLVHRDLRSPVEADVAFRRVLDLDPENTVALRSLGELAKERESHAEAAEFFRKLYLLDPGAKDAAEPVAVDPIPAPPDVQEAPPSPVSIADLAPEEGSFEFSVADLDDVFKVQDRDGATETVAPVDLPEGDPEELAAAAAEAPSSTAPPEWSWSPAPESEAELDPPGLPVEELAPDRPVVSVEDLTPDEPPVPVVDLAPDTLPVPVADLAPERSPDPVHEAPALPVADLAPEGGPPSEMSNVDPHPSPQAAADSDPGSGDEAEAAEAADGEAPSEDDFQAWLERNSL